MSKKNVKKILATLIWLVFLFNAALCLAASSPNLKDAFKPKEGLLDKAAADAGYKTSEVTVEDLIGLGITTVLSFVGVVFLVLAIYGGYIWMIARGNEQEVERAKEIIKNSIIGLAVVIAAYAISWFIINAIGGAALREATPPAS